MTDLIHQFSDVTLDVFSSRRDALRRTGKLGIGAALAALPFLKPGRAQAQSMNGDLGILNFALTLEYLERSFYRQAIATELIPDGETDEANEGIDVLFDTIEEHEAAHVSLLAGAITAAGGTPVDYEDSDFTFDAFLGDFESIATLAQGLEDTGVRAYKGQAAAIVNKAYLTVALQIHSVEARHAAAIRSLAASPATQGWIPLAQPGSPAAIAPVYAGEGNTEQGGVNLATALSGYTEEQITEAFDETLTMDEVFAIAGQFITGDEGDTPADGDDG